MNENAQQIEFVDSLDTQAAGQGEGVLMYLGFGEQRSRLHYLAGSVKPEFDDDEPVLADVVAAVAEPPEARRFVEPAVWTSPMPAMEAFVALQRWEGIVTECREETFLGHLTDLSAEGPDEEVELLLEDIPDEDRSLVAPGAVFYWAIGYRFEASGQRSRVSSLRFRRLPVWSASELEAARARAGEVAEVFAAD